MYNLKEFRENKNLTQRNIAETLNISQKQYWTYETGRREIPVTYLIKLAKFYETTTDELLGIK